MLDVVAMKTKKMRGQAHIVFRDIATSTQAMRALQGFDFFGKEMVSVAAHLLRATGSLKTEDPVCQGQIERLSETGRRIQASERCDRDCGA